MKETRDNLMSGSDSAGVVAIAQVDKELKAVRLIRRGGSLEVLWVNSVDAGKTDLRAFAVKSGLSLGFRAGASGEEEKASVVGFDATGVVFYSLTVPGVKEGEIAAIVRLQAEARLPLPVDQMELAWRGQHVGDGQVMVTVAAAKKGQLERFVEEVRAFRPAQILLDCEGIVKVWRALFSGDEELAVVISARQRNTRVCLARGGRLVNAVSLDTGIEDFSDSERVGAADRFAQDMRSVLELFGYTDPGAVRIFVLSDGGRILEQMVSSLGSAGLSASAALPQVEKLRGITEGDSEAIYEYRVPIGLALIALDGDVEELDVFGSFYKPRAEKAKKRWYYSLKITGVMAAAALILFLFVLYGVDAASYKRLSSLEANADFEQLMRRQALIKQVAQLRPDLLELLREINSIECKGIMLDRFSFKRGEPASIAGQADGDGHYKFEKMLQGVKDVSDVRMNSSKEAKGDKYKFTITFHYKGFTKKGTRS
ncbi:MAG TPA: hypothetical protein VMX13_18550 [Sedimentisphaerales bacterium]|nr:hypothetical protein [Sedimentisphaerales bacterium]